MNTNKQADDLWNEDLAPTTNDQRTWDWKSYAALWVAMVVCVPTYMLAGGLVAEGMSWWQAVITVLLGNMIVLVPMMLIGHAGAKHGIPFQCYCVLLLGPKAHGFLHLPEAWSLVVGLGSILGLVARRFM
jgi:cytosine/uracil/thiamine/allantoin permease